MAADVLGKLPRRPTPIDIAEAITGTRAGQFLAVRLGLTPNFLRNISVDDPDRTELVWKEAVDIWKSTESPKITSAVLAAAIVKQLPQHDSLLANMKIDFHDIEEAIRWYERIKALIDQYKEKPLNTGGIARDWSFWLYATAESICSEY